MSVEPQTRKQGNKETRGTRSVNNLVNEEQHNNNDDNDDNDENDDITNTTNQHQPTNAYHPIVSASLAPLVNCPWCRWQWFPPPCLLVGATVSVGCSVVQWPCCTPLRACGPLRCVVVLLTTLAKGRRTGVKRVKRVKRVVMKNMKNTKNNKKVNNKQKAQRTTTQRHRQQQQQQQQHFSYLHRFPCRATRFE